MAIVKLLGHCYKDTVIVMPYSIAANKPFSITTHIGMRAIIIVGLILFTLSLVWFIITQYHFIYICYQQSTFIRSQKLVWFSSSQHKNTWTLLTLTASFWKYNLVLVSKQGTWLVKLLVSASLFAHFVVSNI